MEQTDKKRQEIKSPIVFLKQDPDTPEQAMNGIGISDTIVSTPDQGKTGQKTGSRITDPKARMDAQFDYYLKKAQFDYTLQGWKNEQRLAYEQQHEQLLFNLREYQRRIGSVVFSDQNGITWYGLVSPTHTDNSNEIVMSSRLLNVMNYHSRRLVSYPASKDSMAVEVLEISWGSDTLNKDRIYWDLGSKNDSSKAFVRKLRTKGVLLLVSGRTTNQAADALLAYSYSSAEETEIPFHYGWNFMDDWVFADEEALTMEEVLKCL